MQISTVLVCLLLMIAVCSPQLLAQPAPVRTTCCFTVASKKIPIRLLESYRKFTDSKCPRTMVIFKTKEGKEVCAEPKKKWVQDSMKYLDQKSINNQRF